MSWIEIEPTSFTVRLFKDGKGYWDDYEAIMMVQKMGHIGFVSGLHGRMRRSDHDKCCDMLRDEHGITELRWLKRGVEKSYDNGE
jgi:hypothetical protein